MVKGFFYNILNFMTINIIIFSLEQNITQDNYLYLTIKQVEDNIIEKGL